MKTGWFAGVTINGLLIFVLPLNGLRRNADAMKYRSRYHTLFAVQVMLK
jgi:hypothetical protein